MAILLLVLASLWTSVLSSIAIPAFALNDALGYRVARIWGRGCLFIYGIRLDILFTHNIPQKGGLIVAPNHQGVFDMPLLVCLPIQMRWLAKAEFKQVPFLGWALMTMGSYFVSRRDSHKDLHVLQEVEKGLIEGKRVLIFPEGTRTRDGSLQAFKKGAFRAAQNTAVPLLPVAVHGSFEIAEPGHLPRKRGHFVSIRIGAPVRPIAGEETESLMARFRKEMVRLLDEPHAS